MLDLEVATGNISIADYQLERGGRKDCAKFVILSGYSGFVCYFGNLMQSSILGQLSFSCLVFQTEEQAGGALLIDSKEQDQAAF